eukprot:scaffold10820_cov54-Phaeocystis_antarctica.AAC.4
MPRQVACQARPVPRLEAAKIITNVDAPHRAAGRRLALAVFEDATSRPGGRDYAAMCPKARPLLLIARLLRHIKSDPRLHETQHSSCHLFQPILDDGVPGLVSKEFKRPGLARVRRGHWRDHAAQRVERLAVEVGIDATLVLHPNHPEQVSTLGTPEQREVGLRLVTRGTGHNVAPRMRVVEEGIFMIRVEGPPPLNEVCIPAAHHRLKVLAELNDSSWDAPTLCCFDQSWAVAGRSRVPRRGNVSRHVAASTCCVLGGTHENIRSPNVGLLALHDIAIGPRHGRSVLRGRARRA